jgi:hypothetical protein
MHLLMGLVGFILVIGGLWILWRDQTIEGLADTSTVMMVSLTPNNTYYADLGLTNSPNWMAAGGTYKQISGSMGRVLAVDSGNRAYYGTQYGITGSAFRYAVIPGNVTQVSFSYPMAVGLTTSQTVVYIDNVPANPETAIWAAVEGPQAGRRFNYIATSVGMAIGAGTDNQMWYCSDIHVPNWVNISTGVLAGVPVKSIAFDNDEVAVIDATDNVYFANRRISTSPNWMRLNSQRLKQISIRNNMGVGLGPDNRIFFAAKIDDNSWAPVNGPPGGSTWVEVFYPAGGNMVSFRAATLTSKGYTCNANELLQNGVCVTKCPIGTAPDGELCKENLKVVDIPNTIKCTSSPYNSFKKWLCETPSDYATLIKNPTNITTYVSPKDEVCVTEDPTTKMYFCVTGAEAKAGKNPLQSIGSDFALSCSTITKRYTDLSNNLTNLIKIQNGLRGGSIGLDSASTSLSNIYNQIGCNGASGTKGTLCTQIQNASNSVRNNASSVTTTLNAVIPSLQRALDTRTNLFGFKTKFQCPE